MYKNSASTKTKHVQKHNMYKRKYFTKARYMHKSKTSTKQNLYKTLTKKKLVQKHDNIKQNMFSSKRRGKLDCLSV